MLETYTGVKEFTGKHAGRCSKKSNIEDILQRLVEANRIIIEDYHTIQ